MRSKADSAVVAMTVTQDTPVEALLEAWPGIVKFLINEGLPCLVCGEPFWGSIGELARSKDWSEDRLDGLIDRIQAAMQRK